MLDPNLLVPDLDGIPEDDTAEPADAQTDNPDPEDDDQ